MINDPARKGVPEVGRHSEAAYSVPGHLQRHDGPRARGYCALRLGPAQIARRNEHGRCKSGQSRVSLGSRGVGLMRRCGPCVAAREGRPA